MKKINIAINGFGRIGRAVLRQISNKNFIDKIFINDLNEDVNNLIYTYNFDKLVYVFKKYPQIKKKSSYFFLGNKKIYFLNFSSATSFAKIKNLDLIIDSSGVSNNSNDWIKLSKKSSLLKFIFTFDHPLAQITLVLGANESNLKPYHKFISSSICDATALAPFLKTLDKNFKISHGNITTVHPILNYQNLLDGRSASWSFPGQTYSHYSLGRSTIENLIPKPTTAIKITQKSLPGINLSNINSFSYRVPTSIVGSADINLVLKKDFSIDKILKIIQSEVKKQKFKIFDINLLPKVSSDYYTNDFSLIYDHAWTSKKKNMLHAVLWYDNENGYASRVVDQIQYINMLKKKI